ncbi:MAG: aspartate aminotransferase family protein [Syntrophobacterales bacterium]|nr:MAG: aspartate aminotransferase family protein [Syntrophobacterales bacterium]
MEEVLERYRGSTPKSEALFQRAEKVMPGGIGHSYRYHWPYPVYAIRAKGSKFWDVDGNEYVDLWMAHYARITGHAPDFIIDGLAQKLSDGLHVGIVNQHEVEFAEMLCDIIPSAEKVRFCCTGTEATMYAVRLARGYTDRKVILKIEGGWHGPNPELMYKITSPLESAESLGLLPETSRYTKTLPFNDIEAAMRAIAEDAHDLAGVIIEPVPGAGCIPADVHYLKALREETLRVGALLIFDEIITGFRVSLGGAQEEFGIVPDLTTLGKVAGGGMPIGIIVGRRDIMDMCDHITRPNTWERVNIGGGTFSGTPIGMMAGLLQVQYLKESAHLIYPKLREMGERVRRGVEEALRQNGINARCHGYGSLYQVVFPFGKDEGIRSPRDILDRTDSQKRDVEYKLRMMNEGVFVVKGGGALSTEHSDEDIDKIIRATQKIAQEMRA